MAGLSYACFSLVMLDHSPHVAADILAPITSPRRLLAEGASGRSSDKAIEPPLLFREDTITSKSYTPYIARAIEASHAACKDEVRRNLQAHSRCVFLKTSTSTMCLYGKSLELKRSTSLRRLVCGYRPPCPRNKRATRHHGLVGSSKWITAWATVYSLILQHRREKKL